MNIMLATKLMLEMGRRVQPDSRFVERTSGGSNCSTLTERQIVTIERIYQKHFA